MYYINFLYPYLYNYQVKDTALLLKACCGGGGGGGGGYHSFTGLNMTLYMVHTFYHSFNTFALDNTPLSIFSFLPVLTHLTDNTPVHPGLLSLLN